jgi:hypothetical protein
MDSDERARVVLEQPANLLPSAMDFDGPTPAPVGLCEDLHAALVAAYNVLGKALYKFDTGPDRADVHNQRARLKRLANQLEANHMRPRIQRFKQKGDD